jgi:putative methyltransferase (TIGR04325 family)
MYSKGWSNKIYFSYDDLQSKIESYDNDDWVAKQIFKVKSFYKEKELILSRNSLLLSHVQKLNSEKITIIDFGGGLGLSYLSLKAAGYDKITYKIVEMPKIVRAGKKYFNDDENISFYDRLEDVNHSPDIFYIRTSLQYTINPFDTLLKIANLNPKKIILCDTSCGEIDTFLTHQLWGNQKIPYWFLNKEEIIKILLKVGYTLKEESVGQIIDSNKSFDTLKNFPEKYRIKQLLNLIFENENEN